MSTDRRAVVLGGSGFIGRRLLRVVNLPGQDAPATGLPGRVIPIGSGTAASVRWLVRELVAISGVRATVAERQPAGRGTVGNSGGARYITVDTALADQLLRWRARTPLTSSLRAMWLAVSGRAAERGVVSTS